MHGHWFSVAIAGRTAGSLPAAVPQGGTFINRLSAFTTIRKTAATLAVGVGLGAGLMAQASAQSVKIGVIAPMTGAGAPWGMVAAEGPKILAAEVNAKGGLDVAGKKYKVEVIAYDDQYKAADAVAAYNRLVKQDGVKYMIILASPSALALKQSVEDDKVVALTAAASDKAVDASSKFMFRTFSRPADFVPQFFTWIKNNLKERRIAIINPNDETGWDQSKLAETLLKQNGFQIVGNELFERTQKDFNPLLTKLINAKPEVIELGSVTPPTAGVIIRQARELGYKGKFIKSSGPGVKELVAASGKDAAEGTINVLYADPGNQAYLRLATEFKKTVGQEPNELIVPFYDAAAVLLRAIQKAGDVGDTTKVAGAFAQALPMPSVQGGTLTLGGMASSGVDRTIISANYVGQIKDGGSVVIGPMK